MKLQTHVLSYFPGKILFRDGFQNIIVYKPTRNTLNLKEDKSTDYFIGWKPKGCIIPNLKPLYTASLHSIKFSGYRMRIKCDQDPLAVERNIYATAIVNTSTFYDLDTWPKSIINNFKLKNCLFGVATRIKIVVKK